MNPEQDEAYFAAFNTAKMDLVLNLLQSINTGALERLASSLRNDIPCRLPAMYLELGPQFELVRGQSGGQNFHLDIEFEDGVVWIARIRLNLHRSPPQKVRDYVLLSEVVTMKFLETTNVPTPKVFYHTTDQGVCGVPLIIMEKMKGSQLDWQNASSAEKTKVMDQLADVFLDLEKHPFPKAGSLSGVDDNGQLVVNGLADAYYFRTPELCTGPFETLRSSLRGLVEHDLQMIESREHSCLSVDQYLSHQWRLDMIPSMIQSGELSEGTFFLQHQDDKGDHILVDEDHNITAIIDWEFATTESKALAFGSPCMMWPVNDFYNGSNNLSAEELEFAEMFRHRGREDMAQIVLNGRKLQRFLLFRGGATMDQDEFGKLFQGLRAAACEEGGALNSYMAWKAQAIKQYENDAILQGIWGQQQESAM